MEIGACLSQLSSSVVSEWVHGVQDSGGGEDPASLHTAHRELNFLQHDYVLAFNVTEHEKVLYVNRFVSLITRVSVLVPPAGAQVS